MREAFFIILISSILAGLNSYLGLCQDWIVILVVIIGFTYYVESSMCDYVHWKFSKGYIVNLIWITLLVLSVFLYTVWHNQPDLIWYKHFALVMFVPAVDMAVASFTYNGYY